MNDTEMKELEALRKENTELKANANKPLSLKVSEKGAVSVYGMGRFPTTLYKEQMIKLLDKGNDIRAFIKANDKALKAKDAK